MAVRNLIEFDKMLKPFNRAWSSPTITTWFNYFIKSANVILVLPLILKYFDDTEVTIFYLFASIIALSGLADFGFRNTLVRLFGFAAGGAKDITALKSKSDSEGQNNESNWDLTERIFSMMKRIYLYVSLVVLMFSLTIGTYSLIRPVSFTNNQTEVWIAWIIVCFTSSFHFYGNVYSGYLEGFNKVALVNRVTALFSMGSIISSFIILLIAPSILNLFIVRQLWVVINVFRYIILAHMINGRKLGTFSRRPFEKRFFLKVWTPTWRSGISGVMSNGVTELTGIFYAQIGSSGSVASYLLALRLISEIRGVSMAPLYSKIPLMIHLRVQAKLLELTKIAQRGMFIANLTFLSGALFVGVFSDFILNLIGSQTEFVSMQLWLLLSIAFFFHRYGAMHMQVYLTTNHVITHIVDGITGIIVIIVSWILLKPLDLYAFPIGMIAGYLGFYSWCSAKYSLSSLGQNFLKFEKRNLVLFSVFLILFIVIYFTLYK